MKRLCNILLSALLIVFSQPIHAQSILVNGSFEGAYSTGTVSTCNYFFNMNGCYATHGTPQIGGAGAADLLQYAHMWHQNSIPWGEGVALSFNPGTSTVYRRQYDLCFWYRTDNDPGTVNFLLTTNPAQSAFNACGNPIPAFAPAQVLTPVVPLPAAPDWTYYSMTFSADANGYNTLVFYPQNAGAAVFLLDIDGVVLSTCEPALEIDMLNYPVPSGYFERSNYIRAGSHIHGSTTLAAVTADPAVNTTFHAGNFVLLEDNFIASPSSTKYFLAEIGPCTDWCTGGGSRAASSAGTITPDIAEAALQEFSVFPNPSDGMLRFGNLAAGDLIEIFDAQGRRVWSMQTPGPQLLADPEITAAGIYIVKVTSANGKYQTKQLVRN